jgi:hypothetical protein
MKNHKKDILLTVLFSVLILAFIIFCVNIYPDPVFSSATLRGIYQLSPDGPYQVLYDYRGQTQERIFKKFYEAAAFGESLLNSQAR